MKGDPKSSLEYFNDRINVQNFPYFSYFKGLALKATGYSEKAMSIFTEIANYNFSGWEAGLEEHWQRNRLLHNKYIKLLQLLNLPQHAKK